jgi:hypothetical protein
MVVYAPLRDVASIDEEERLMGQCQCGGDWQLVRNWVGPTLGRWYDDIVVQCQDCGIARLFEFEVSRFIEVRPQVWSRLHGMSALRYHPEAADTAENSDGDLLAGRPAEMPVA